VIRAFLDANVLFTAACSHTGSSWAIIQEARVNDNLVVMTTDRVFGEAEENLQEKAPASLDEYALLKPILWRCPEPSDALAEHLSSVIRYPKDRPVLAGAISAKADWLLTWDDDHFGHLYGIRVYDVLVSNPGSGLHMFRHLAGGML
jgi:predicted nucleic acid-binding protein